MRGWLWLAALALAARGEDLPRGRVLDEVKCAAHPSQSYALYVPSTYSEDRPASVIFAFDPRGRGRVAVEAFQAGAEKYGYIVAGSNNSRNGAWETSLAAEAMSVDVSTRFPVDAGRLYTAGLSGGARVATYVALRSGKIAGVIASSAGFPEGKPRKSAPFALFGTAGTEDFNYLEMRQLDRALTTPHRVVIFEGGHTWLSSELAAEALEWLELQAMKSGRRPRDEALLESIFERRKERAAAMQGERAAWEACEALAVDFRGLRDVTEFSARAAELRQRKSVQAALRKERSLEDREARLTGEITGLERTLGDPSRREGSLEELRLRLRALAKDAGAAADSDERRLARRLLRLLLIGAVEGNRDPEYRALLEEIRPAAGAAFGGPRR